MINNFDSVRDIITNLPPVGTYTRPDNRKIPAVWYGAEPPSEYTVKGVEVIITETDFTYSIPVGSPNSRLETSVIEVSLIQHEKGAENNRDFTKLKNYLVENMRANFYRVDVISMPGTNNILEEFRVRGHLILQRLLST